MLKNKTYIYIILILLIGLFIFGCDLSNVTISDVIEGGQETKEFLDEVNKALRDDFTEEERYYVGRATCAYVFSKYELVENEELTEYLNQVGITNAMASNKSTTFNGYRFVVFDDDYPNAYGTPGGMILISVGMLKLCDNEDELAAVLAHEVEHIVKDHPMKAVSKETRKAALLNIAKMTVAKTSEKYQNNFTKYLSLAVESFDGVLKDILNALEKGYNKNTEYEADAGAVPTLSRAGYNVDSLISIIDKLPHNEESNYGSNHPTPQERIEAIKEVKKEEGISSTNILDKRTNRFKEVMKNAGIK